MGLISLRLHQSNALSVVYVLFKELVRVIQLLKRRGRENRSHALPKIHHIRRSHGQRFNQFGLFLQTLGCHGCHGVELYKFLLGFAILSFRFCAHIALEVDESCKIFLQHNILSLGTRSVNDSGFNVFFSYGGKPVAKLRGISNSGTQSQHGTVARLDDSLQSISFRAVQGVDLIQHKVVELTISTIQDHKFTFSFGHFITSSSADF